MGKKSRLKPGPVGRERNGISLRLEPGLAEWYAQAAAGAKKSRNAFMEAWLAVLPEVIERLKSRDPEKEDLTDSVEVVGVEMIERLLSLGFASGVLRMSLQWRRDEQQSAYEQIAREQFEEKFSKSKVKGAK